MDAPGLPSRKRFDPIDFAPGLPSKTDFKNIKQQRNTRLVIQEHSTIRNPISHYDMRLKDKGIAHSWVIRSLPGDKKKALAIQQPTHTAKYMNFEGEIKKGYGAGTVKKVYDNNVKVHSASDDKIKMKLPEGEFVMVRTKDKNWLMIKTAAITSKQKYKTGVVDLFNPDTVLQPKVDGAHTIMELSDEEANEIYSYRTSKKTGEPIQHSDQLPHLRDLNIPKSLSGTTLRVELYGKTDKGPLPAEQISGILNAGTQKSIEKQKQFAPLQPYVFNIEKFKGKDVSREPYTKKLEMMKQIESQVPILRVAETATTPDEKKKMFNDIKNKRHPDTVEGVVEWHKTKPGGAPVRQKFRDSHDVYVRSIYPAISKTKHEAGGFAYSLTPKGKIVGNVGTGFTQEKRKDMLINPNKYIGMVARVKSPQQYSSGALRAPAFYTMDIEKNLKN